MRHRSYKFRLYPNKQQKELIEKHFGAVRWVYNWALEQKIKAYQETGAAPSRYDLTNMLPAIKKQEETSWLGEVNSQSLQSAISALDTAFVRFFKKMSKFPRFKSRKKCRDSAEFVQHVYVNYDSKQIRLIKFKEGIRCVFDRKIDGTIKSATISKTPTEKYFVSILVTQDAEAPTPPILSEDRAVGIDLGLKHFLTTSAGQKVENPRYLKKSQKRLARAQRKLSRRKKESQRQERQRIKVANIYEHVANQRKHFLHETSRRLVNESQVDTYVMETLSVQEMLSKGFRSMRRSINDASWSEFVCQMKYKCEWAGKNFVQIGRFEPSSKMCSCCGQINRELTLADREWICDCGAAHDRDINAAKNIKHFAFVSKFQSTAESAGTHARGDCSSSRGSEKSRKR